MRSPASTICRGRCDRRARSAPASTCVVSASCGRNVGVYVPPRRSRNVARAGDSSSRTCASVTTPNRASSAPPSPLRPGRGPCGPRATRRGSARARRSRRVAPRRARRRAALPGRRGRVAAAAEQRDDHRAEQEGERASLIRRAAPRRSTRAARAARRRAPRAGTAVRARPRRRATRPTVARGTRSAYPAARLPTRGARATDSTTSPSSAAGTAATRTTPEQQPDDGRRPGAARAQDRDRAAALQGDDGEALHERVEAHESRDERDDPQERRQRREDLPVRARGSGDGGRRRPERPEPRSMRARSAPGRERTTIFGVSRAPALRSGGPDVGHPPVGLERADDADDAEPRLAARLELHGQRPAEAQVQRVGEAEAHLGLVGRRHAPAGRERRLLEDGVVAREADEAHRLAQRVGVRALRPGSAATAVGRPGSLDRGQLVGRAARPRCRSACPACRGRRAAPRAGTRARAAARRWRRTRRAQRRCPRTGPVVPRAQPAAEPQRAREPTPAPRSRGVRELRAAQQRHGAARGRPQAGHADAAATSATVAASAIASGPSSALPGGSSLSVARRSPVGPATTRAPSASPTMAAGSATMAARARTQRRSSPAGTRARAARRSWTGAAARRRARHAEHHARRPEHDGRERDEQRQHDPCRLVEQHPDAVVRDEAQVLTPNVARACCSVMSTRAGIVGPHQGHVRLPRSQASPSCAAT